jgi:hypothetical protein
MRRARILGVAAAVGALLLALYASRAPETGPAGHEPGAEDPAPDRPGEVPRLVPAGGEHALDPGAPASAPAGEAPAAAEPPAGAEAMSDAAPGTPRLVPLESLLGWSEPRPAPGIDLGSAAKAGADPEAPKGSGLSGRVTLQRHSEDLPPGSSQRRLETTDVGVRVPVDESVSLKGGVRIESREEGEKHVQEKTPTVGVEVRF